jgi:hypothetical protein
MAEKDYHQINLSQIRKKIFIAVKVKIKLKIVKKRIA